jgi:pyridoxamine 5'-phosphate oxidase
MTSEDSATQTSLRPDLIEFWQGDRGRRHQRLRYELADGHWSRGLLWP